MRFIKVIPRINNLLDIIAFRNIYVKFLKDNVIHYKVIMNHIKSSLFEVDTSPVSSIK